MFALLGSGCYRYVPVQLSTVRPNEDVRVRVTESAAARLVKEFGTYTTELEGQVAREPSDSVSVSVLIGREYRGVSLESGRQVLFLGPSEVVGVRRRELARGRTVLASAGALVVFGLVIGTVIQLGDPNPSPDQPPPPPPASGARLPIR
jgi:hypothetical protein